MRRIVFGLIVGFLVGYQLGRRAVGGSEATAETTGQGRKLMNGAARVGLQAIQRARSRVRGRRGAEPDASWN
ncbi:MAG: hypothetical protein HYU54_11160 [Actinobacteria bacterium]|nr:hypothetical protein [Actinomycetota bacterium]